MKFFAYLFIFQLLHRFCYFWIDKRKRSIFRQEHTTRSHKTGKYKKVIVVGVDKMTSIN